MRKDTPMEKWSAGQLLAEVRRLQKRGTVEATTREADLDAELGRARAREASLLNELSAARGEADAEGIAPDEVAGKPAVAKYRRLWMRFSLAVTRLPAVRRQRGYAVAEMTVARDLVGDLQLFEADAPRGKAEVRERDRLRRMLTSPAFKTLLMRDDAWADTARVQFLSQVARAFLRPSIWTIIDKSPDEGALDRLGTVYK